MTDLGSQRIIGDGLALSFRSLAGSTANVNVNDARNRKRLTDANVSGDSLESFAVHLKIGCFLLSSLAILSRFEKLAKNKPISRCD